MTSFSSSRSLLNFPRQREKRQRRGGGCWGERKGPEVCLGGRWLSVAVNRQLFDAIVLAQACLSHSVTAIKDSLTAKTGACVSQANPHILSFTPGIINFVKSGSVNYEGARSLSPEEKTKQKQNCWSDTAVPSVHCIWLLVNVWKKILHSFHFILFTQCLHGVTCLQCYMLLKVNKWLIKGFTSCN